MAAWDGIGTLGLGWSLVRTKGGKRRVGVRRVADRVCVKTAKNAGLEDQRKADAGGDPARYAAFLVAIALNTALHARCPSLHLYIVRLSAASTLCSICAARASGPRSPSRHAFAT